MGVALSRIGDSLSGKKTFRVLMNGGDGSGKTTLLYKWKLGEVVTTIPTIGFNVEEISLPPLPKGGDGTIINVDMWDFGGRVKVRALFPMYYPGTKCVVWVIDSTDQNQFEQIFDELYRTSQHKDLKDIPILILCNKQDRPDALSPDEIGKQLDLSRFRGHRVQMMGLSALKGDGLDEALQRLKDLLMNPTLSSEEEVNPTLQLTASLDYNDVTPKWPDFGLTTKEGNLTLQRFELIQKNTECPFAKSAILWGGKSMNDDDDNEGMSLALQARANYSTIFHFVQQIEMGVKLDGLCFEINHPLARTANVVEFGECIREFLTALSDLDPRKEFIMRVPYVGSTGWRFRFHGMDFFVTTFAPCYSITSSRYVFGTGRAFLLLQPELSFARHQLTPDTVETAWEKPKTMRDITRIAYKKAGRSYYIPKTLRYPPAEHIVKPLIDDGRSVVKWWEPPIQNKA